MRRGIAVGLFVLGALSGAASASAQNINELQIKAEGSVVRADGGEQSQVFSSSGSLQIGKATSSAFGYTVGRCGLDVGPRLQSDAVKGWTLDFTPTGTQGLAVTFHVRWTRLDGGKQAAPVEVDLTLRPGESFPIDSLSIPTPTSSSGCRLLAMTLRVRVDYWPPPEFETRLVATDLWLVERSADGAERTQPLTLRGLPNDSMPFFFAPLTEGGTSLDIYGELRAAPEQGDIVLSLTVRSRTVEGGRSSTIWRNGNSMTSRKIDPVLKAKPGEVVSVELPRLTENQSGAFASKTLSLRMRTQQVR
jgi:hypothetical protein